VPADVPMGPCQRVVEVGVLLAAYSAITGWAALAWQGGWWFDGMRADGQTHRPVPIAASRHRMRSQAGMHICEERWDPKDVIVVDGLAVTTPVRSAWFEMRYAESLHRAVAVLDMAAFHDLVSIEEARHFALQHPSYTGIEQCRNAIPLADENAWSPAEPPMRMLWEAAGYPRPLTNRPVFDLAGNHLGTPDLIDPVSGVLGEYDGPIHLASGQRHRDLNRAEQFRSHGLESATMVTGDRADPTAFLGRLRGAYERAAEVPASRRRWTLELPSWWRPTFTVAQRRALDAEQRAVWLRHRAA
jgi:hypothetical protein